MDANKIKRKRVGLDSRPPRFRGNDEGWCFGFGWRLLFWGGVGRPGSG